MKEFDECQPSELEAYDDAEETKEQTLRRAKTKLHRRNIELIKTDPEWLENKAEIADLKVALAIHRNKVAAFYESRAGINPPTDTQLASLKEQLDAVNRLTANRRIIGEIVGAVTEAAKTFNEIQPKP